MKKPCALHNAAHHSKDRVRVFHGRTEPLILCGFHAQPVWVKENIRLAQEASA